MEKVVLYGLGTAGKALFDYISNRYEIEYWVDSDEKKWGTTYNGVSIKSPECLKDYEGKVIVTTTDSFFIEIADYLVGIGLKKEQIFRGQHRVCDQEEEVIPYDCELLCNQFEKSDKSLIDYDLLHNDEEKKPLKVMFFVAFYTVYLNKLVENIKKRFPGISIGVLSNSETYVTVLGEYVDHIYVYHSYRELNDIIDKIPVYSAFQFLWIENIWVFFANKLREKCNKLNLCVGGSDLYRARDAEANYKATLIDMSDNISAETDGTIECFLRRYPSVKRKMHWVNFGIDAIDYIDSGKVEDTVEIKKRFGLPLDKIVITCGHNAGEAHQHIRIIDSIKKIDRDILKKVVFVFPMTYPAGKEGYIGVVDSKLKSLQVDYKILTEFMDAKSMAEYATISDVMVHVQTTDQLSSTMLEEMYAGTVVIAGDWLPYEMLANRGVVFYTVADFDELSSLIEKIVDDYPKCRIECQKNKDAIKMISSWDNAFDRWKSLW